MKLSFSIHGSFLEGVFSSSPSGLILIDGDLLLVPWDTGGDTGSGGEEGWFPVNGLDKDNNPGVDLEIGEGPAAEIEVGGSPDAGLDDVEALEGGRERGYNSGVVSNTWSCSSMVMTGILQPASRTGGSDTQRGLPISISLESNASK